MICIRFAVIGVYIALWREIRRKKRAGYLIRLTKKLWLATDGVTFPNHLLFLFVAVHCATY